MSASGTGPGGRVPSDDKRRGPALRLVAMLLAAESVLGVVYLAVALVAIKVTRVDGVALLWPGNAIVAAVLIRKEQVRWSLVTTSVLVGCMLANRLASNTSWSMAAGFSLINLAEIGAMAFVFRRVFHYPYPAITIGQACVMTVVLGLSIPGLAALAGSAILHGVAGLAFWSTARDWWMSDALGACLFAPPIILYSRQGLLRLVEPRHLAMNVVVVLGCIVATWFAVRYVSFPFVVMALMPMVAAFRVGGFGTSVLSLCVAVTLAVLWITDIRPQGLEPAAATAVLAGLPFIALLAAAMPPVAVGLGTDERRAAVRALRASEQQLRDSMAHSPLGMIVLDLDGRWLYSNESLHRMLGFTAEELAGCDIESLASTAELTDLRQRWQQLLAGDVNSHALAQRFRHRDGHWVWTHCAVSLARDSNGQPKHFITQVESLEESRRAEARLAAERELLRATLGSVADAVVTTDTTGAITYMNRAAAALVGREPGALQDHNLVEILNLTEPETRLPVENLFGRCVLELREVRRTEACALHRPDGTVCYIRETITPVMDDDWCLTSLVVVLHDVTESRAAALDLRHQATHDTLTGLLNRAGFEIRLQEAFSSARAHGTPATLIAIDLDCFKAVNDSAGHAAGDAVLREVGAAIRRMIRPSDAVGRIGGDEFAVLLNDCNERAGRDIARSLLAALNPLRTRHDSAVHITGASLGTAQWHVQFRDSAEWVAAADSACYQAKRAGRGVEKRWKRAPGTRSAR